MQNSSAGALLSDLSSKMNYTNWEETRRQLLVEGRQTAMLTLCTPHGTAMSPKCQDSDRLAEDSSYPGSTSY